MCTFDKGYRGLKKHWLVNLMALLILASYCFEVFAQPGAANSYVDLKRARLALKDGEYFIYATTKCDNPIKVYCFAMNSSHPKEFITLPAGVDKNYSYVFGWRLPHRPYSARYRCSGKPGRVNYSQAGMTKFRKVRLDLARMAIVVDDFTFAKSEPFGKRVAYYGSAGDCYSMNYNGSCRRGHFEVDLTHTGLRLKPSTEWQTIGFPPGVKITNYKRSKDGTSVSAKCGGWCEKCRPIGGMLVEQTACRKRAVNLPCGLRPPHSGIVGSGNTNSGAWPWQVPVKHQFMGHLCGGSVIGPRWIHTAAHCFDKFSPTNFTIIAGEHHLRTDDGFEQEVAIERFFKHPRYNLTCRHNYDVALLKLNRTLKYNNRVGPVCLPESDFRQSDNRTNCFVTGWGTTENSPQTPSQILKEAQLPLVSRYNCRKSLNDLRRFGYCVTKRMRCAGYARGGVDACRGDSGGPLVCYRNRKWYMGVVSWGAGCGLMGRYGVYADVLRLRRWIQDTIQDA